MGERHPTPRAQSSVVGAHHRDGGGDGGGLGFAGVGAAVAVASGAAAAARGVSRVVAGGALRESCGSGAVAMFVSPCGYVEGLLGVDRMKAASERSGLFWPRHSNQRPGQRSLYARESMGHPKRLKLACGPEASVSFRAPNSKSDVQTHTHTLGRNPLKSR